VHWTVCTRPLYCIISYQTNQALHYELLLTHINTCSSSSDVLRVQRWGMHHVLVQCATIIRLIGRLFQCRRVTGRNSQGSKYIWPRNLQVTWLVIPNKNDWLDRLSGFKFNPANAHSDLWLHSCITNLKNIWHEQLIISTWSSTSVELLTAHINWITRRQPGTY